MEKYLPLVQKQKSPHELNYTIKKPNINLVNEHSNSSYKYKGIY